MKKLLLAFVIFVLPGGFIGLIIFQWFFRKKVIDLESMRKSFDLFDDDFENQTDRPLLKLRVSRDGKTCTARLSDGSHISFKMDGPEKSEEVAEWFQKHNNNHYATYIFV